jgi:predicted ester cyclase
MATEHEALVSRWFEDLFNTGNLDALEEIASANCVLHLPGGGAAEGLRAIRAIFEWYHSAIAEAPWTIHQIIAAQNWLTVRASGEGHYCGGWQGIPGAGQLVKETSINIFHVEDDRIAEVWFEVSDLDVVRQLGAFPPARP